jgi:hypothetical protein
VGIRFIYSKANNNHMTKKVVKAIKIDVAEKLNKCNCCKGGMGGASLDS